MRRGARTGFLMLAVAGLALPGATCGDPVEPRGGGPPGGEPPAVDHEFDDGSGVAAQELSDVQVENLALLARVWGFAKYHHPRVAAGAHNWDYELFRALPPVLAAANRAEAQTAIATWLDGFALTASCGPCAQAPGDAHLLPDVDWIEDTALLGAAVSAHLVEFHRNRPAGASQRYVSFAPNVGNPDFSAEARYADHPEPDAGYRLLALFRFWNIIEYWFPYRNVLDDDWSRVLQDFIPVLMEPLDGDAYRRALIRLIGRVDDTHANLWSDLALRPPVGNEEVPVGARFVDDQLVVTAYTHATLGPATGLEVGDVIRSIDGVDVPTLVDSLAPYYPASNRPTRLRDMARALLRGTGPVTLTGDGATGGFTRSVARAPRASLDLVAGYRHDRPGPAFQMLTDSVAYLTLSSVVSAAAADYVRQAEGAAVLVIDLRTYPSEFVVFTLGGHLVDAPRPFARFTRGDAANPGAFLWGPPVGHTPREPRFRGTVVLLVDETTQSQAEYTTMAFRVAPDAWVVGSTTAGADGNVSRIPLPGGAEGMISGIGVFYPDRTPTQRIGIVPDLEVRPTLAGIRAGRDEVLEAGVGHALGRTFRLPVEAAPTGARR